jgi:hypothetical protein
MVAESDQRQAEKVIDHEAVARFIAYQRRRDVERKEAVRSFIARLIGGGL